MVLTVDAPAIVKRNRHTWTEAENDIIRRDYKGTYKSASEIAQYISILTGERITRCSVYNQASRMGLHGFERSFWAPEENTLLAELIAIYPLDVVAEKLGRSKYSVRAHATRIHLSTKVRDGWFTHEEACHILGVDHRTLQSWISAGRLIAYKHTDTIPLKGGSVMWHITSTALADFIKTCASELTGRNVDAFMIVELIKGGV